MQFIWFVIIKVLLNHDFIHGLAMKEVTVQNNENLQDQSNQHPTDLDNKVTNNAVLPDNADENEFEDNDNKYQYSKEADAYFYSQMQEFEELLNDHMQGLDESISQQQYGSDDTTTIANEEFMSTKEKFAYTKTIATEGIPTTLDIESDKISATWDSYTTEITTEQQLTLENTNTTTDMVFQNTPANTIGYTNELHLITDEILSENESADLESTTSSMKPPLSSAGVKISQVEKRLSALFPGANSSSHSGKANDDKRAKNRNNMNEINGFIAEIQQQTPLIVFGCAMSIIIFIALVFFAYRIMNRLNETATVALIRHSEHPDVLPPHQQYQVQKLLVKQQMQEEKVLQQRLLQQQLQHKADNKKSKKVPKIQTELPLKDCLELQESHAENEASETSQKCENSEERTSDENVSQSNKTNSCENENDCNSSSCSFSTDKGTENDESLDSKKLKTYSSPDKMYRSHCINIIIENGNCLDCIEAVQKRSSETYSKENEYTTVTYHLGDGVCNDHNHNE